MARADHKIERKPTSVPGMGIVGRETCRRCGRQGSDLDGPCQSLPREIPVPARSRAGNERPVWAGR